jgi:hypothetical protein
MSAGTYPTNTQKNYNTSEYSVFSDCATAQHNTPSILRYIKKIYNTGKKLEEQGDTKIY